MTTGADLPLILTEWIDDRHPKGTTRDTTWGLFFGSRFFRKPPEAKTKSRLSGWSPVEFDGGHRKKEKALRAFGLGLDYEPAYDVPKKDAPKDTPCVTTAYGATISQAVDLWKPYYGLLHTSWSHLQPQKKGFPCEPGPRFRVILVFSRPVDPASFGKIWRWAAAKARVAGHHIDEGVKDISRLWYAPGVAPGFPYEVVDLGGDPIDVDAILGEAEPEPPKPEASSTTPAIGTRSPAVSASGAPLKPSAAGTPQRSTYVQAAIGKAVRMLVEAPHGKRNEEMSRQAFGLGGFVGAGELDEDFVRQTLLNAARAAGWDDEPRTLGTINRQLREGARKPRHAPKDGWKGKAPAAPAEPPPGRFEDEEPDLKSFDPEIDGPGEVEEEGPETQREGTAPPTPPPPPTPPAAPPGGSNPPPSGPQSGPITAGTRVKDIFGDKHRGHPDLDVGFPFDITPDSVTVSRQVFGQQGQAMVIPITEHPVYVFEEIEADTDGIAMHLAWRVMGQVRTCTAPRSLLHDPKKLGAAVEARGLLVRPGQVNDFAKYLSAFLRRNEPRIPTRKARWTTGWDEKKRSFMYGNTPIGCEGDVLYRIHEDQGASTVLEAIHSKGDHEVWRKAVNAMLKDTPAAALMLSVAVASPMLELFNWLPIGIVFGDLGGAGKSSLLRVAGSVFGATGSAAKRQVGGIVGSGTGTPKGLVMQFRRFAGFPHLADEFKPEISDNRKKNELSDAMHAISEGREHVRANRDSRGTMGGWSFLGCSALAGEVAAWDFLRKGGAIRRYLIPRSPYSKGKEPLGKYVPALADNYGHLGRAIVERLVASTDEERKAWAAYRGQARLEAEMIAKAASAAEDQETVRSWTEQIAVAVAACRVALDAVGRMCPDGADWEKGIWDAWRELLGYSLQDNESSDVVTRAWHMVRGWIATHRHDLAPSSAKLKDIEKNSIQGRVSDLDRHVVFGQRGCIGRIFQAENEGQAEEELVLVDVIPEALQRLFEENGQSVRTLLRSFVERGYLITQKSDDGRFTTRAKINGTLVHVFRLNLATQDEADVGRTPHQEQAAQLRLSPRVIVAGVNHPGRCEGRRLPHRVSALGHLPARCWP